MNASLYFSFSLLNAAVGRLSVFLLIALALGSSLSAQQLVNGKAIGIHAKMVGSSSSASYTVSFAGDDGNESVTLSGSGTKEDSIFAQMKTDVEYTISLTKNSTATSAKLKMSAPTGWIFYIRVDGDIFERDT